MVINAKLFKELSQFIHMRSPVGLRCAHRQYFLHPAPVQQECQGGPATSRSDNLRRYSSEEQLDRASNAKTMAKDVSQSSARPNADTEFHEPVLGHMFPASGVAGGVGK